MTIVSSDALFVAVSLSLVGIYILFLPNDFKKRIGKTHNRWVRCLGGVVILVGVGIFATDFKAQKLAEAFLGRFEDTFGPYAQDNHGDISTEQKGRTGRALPNFTFQSIQEAVPPIAIKDLQGKPSVLVFWATHNTSWSSNLAVAQDLYEERDKLKINVVALAVDDSNEDIRQWLQKRPSKMPVYHDPNAKYKRRLVAIGSVEQVFIVDAMTKVQIILEAPQGYNEIKAALDRTQ